MERDPLSCVGLVSYLDESAGSRSILGTCAAFRQPHIALTAAHTVREIVKPTRVRIDYPRRALTRTVSRVALHPSADLALLVSPPDESDAFEGYREGAFSNFVGNWSLGEDLFAYGFPLEGPQMDAQTLL